MHGTGKRKASAGREKDLDLELKTMHGEEAAHPLTPLSRSLLAKARVLYYSTPVV